MTTLIVLSGTYAIINVLIGSIVAAVAAQMIYSALYEWGIAKV